MIPQSDCLVARFVKYNTNLFDNAVRLMVPRPFCDCAGLNYCCVWLLLLAVLYQLFLKYKFATTTSYVLIFDMTHAKTQVQA